MPIRPRPSRRSRVPAWFESLQEKCGEPIAEVRFADGRIYRPPGPDGRRHAPCWRAAAWALATGEGVDEAARQAGTSAEQVRRRLGRPGPPGRLQHMVDELILERRQASAFRAMAYAERQLIAMVAAPGDGSDRALRHWLVRHGVARALAEPAAFEAAPQQRQIARNERKTGTNKGETASNKRQIAANKRHAGAKMAETGAAPSEAALSPAPVPSAPSPAPWERGDPRGGAGG
jgi:hypothetical protein